MSLTDSIDATTAAIMVGSSVGLFVIGVLSVPFVIARLPEDYFVRDDKSSGAEQSGPAVKHAILKPLRNVLGVLLVLAGVAMLVLPGQGVLAILLGLSLIDFPGKRRLLLKLMRRRTIERVVNGIRRRAHKPPLKLETEHE
jgi:hypothetical protein